MCRAVSEPRRALIGQTNALTACGRRRTFGGMEVEGITRANGDQRSASRLPGYLHGVLTLVMLLVFALLTFTPPPSSPPAIAEVAPKAVEQITEAPVEQAVAAGGTAGGVGAATPGAASTTLPPNLGEEEPPEPPPTPFRCLSQPPRQIEDPQSPPCVPYWEGDNGGATTQGVTRDRITVVVPDMPRGWNVIEAYEAFFNKRFQFYGRKLDLIGIVNEQGLGPDEASSQRNLAQKVDEEYQAFASLALYEMQGTVYYRELARREVLAVTDYAQFTEQQLDDLNPYVWQYGMALDRMMSIAGDWICSRLVGREADYTTDPALFGRPRKLGLVWQDSAGNRFDPSQVTGAVKACGSSFAVMRHLEPNYQQGANSTGAQYTEDPTVQNAVIDLKREGVTTVLCLCHTNVLGALSQNATRQRYFPEWTVTSYVFAEYLATQQLNNSNPQQRQSLFGVSFIPRLLKYADDPSVWPLQEEGGVFVPTRDDSTALRQGIYHKLYRTLLLLSSGIQMAGPNLTPETFAAGLRRTLFPNPETKHKAGRVGFGGGSSSMTLDATEFWWSNNARSPYGNDPPGTWCYIDGGARKRSGQFTGAPRFFEGACDAG